MLKCKLPGVHKVIVVEGPDCVGKSSTIMILKDMVEKNTKYKCKVYGPSASMYGLGVKKLLNDPFIRVNNEPTPKAEALLQLSTTINLREKLETLYQDKEEEVVIILDRWLPSFHVYQVQINKFDYDVKDLVRYAYSIVDKTFILLASDEVLDKRFNERGEIADRYEVPEMLLKVREGYRKLAEAVKDECANHLAIDTSDMNPTQVADVILNKSGLLE